MFEYEAVCVNVVDGDTLDVTIDLGFRMTTTQRVRLYGVDTPEVGQPLHDEAKGKLQELTIARKLVCRTAKPHEKYGRWLATISTDQCADVATAIIAAGLGVPYFGGHKESP